MILLEVNSRHKYVLERCFSKISLEGKQKAKYITMDMWEPYLNVAKRYFRNAKIAIVLEVKKNITKKDNGVLYI